jgi:putative intracellular protease/amidase
MFTFRDDPDVRRVVRAFYDAGKVTALFAAAPAFRPHAVRDGHLVTGQQQYSARAAARLVIEALGH